MRTRSWMAAAGVLAALACRAPGPNRGATGSVAALAVTHAVAWGDSAIAAVTIGFRIRNEGSTADTLVAATSPDGDVTLHDVVFAGGTRRMTPVKGVVLAPGASLVFGRGRQHLMVARTDSSVWLTRTIPVVLRFARAGALRLRVPVLRFSEAVEELEGARRER